MRSAECVSKSRRVGQRRFDYAFSSVSSGFNLLGSYLGLIRNTGASTIGIIASPLPLSGTIVPGTRDLASSLGMKVQFVQSLRAGQSVENTTAMMRNLSSLYRESLDSLIVVISASVSDVEAGIAILHALKDLDWAPKSVSWAGGGFPQVCLSRAAAAAQRLPRLDSCALRLTTLLPWSLLSVLCMHCADRHSGPVSGH
jgi:hypothetical protein